LKARVAGENWVCLRPPGRKAGPSSHSPRQARLALPQDDNSFLEDQFFFEKTADKTIIGQFAMPEAADGELPDDPLTRFPDYSI